MLCRQLDLYEEFLVPIAEAPIDAGESALTPKEYQPAPSPNKNGETAVLRSELTRGDDAHQHSGGKQRKTGEPQEAPSIFARRTSIIGEDAAFGSSPEWKLVRLDSIDLHPSLPALYKRQNIVFPPEPPDRYLSPHGIQSAARYAPIHARVEGSRLLCFAGIRLYLAAQRALGLSARIGAFIYEAITDAEMAEAIDMSEQILPIWFRETRAQRKAHELRHLAGTDPRGLTHQDQDQQQLSELFKTCTRTVQHRVASRRKIQKV